MASVTGKPFAAALELDRDDVVRSAIMRAARLRIDIDADNTMWEGPQCPDIFGIHS